MKDFKKVNRPDELKDTCELMMSDKYYERFRAEYYQLAIRAKKLQKMLQDWQTGKLKFTPSCDYGLLVKQFNLMDEYMMILRVRAQIEGIEL